MGSASKPTALTDRKRAHRKMEREKHDHCIANSSCLHERDARLCQSKLHAKENCSHEEGRAAFGTGHDFPLEAPLVLGRDQIVGFCGTGMRSGRSSSHHGVSKHTVSAHLCKIRDLGSACIRLYDLVAQFQPVLLIKGDCPLLATFHETDCLRFSCPHHLSPSFFPLWDVKNSH